MRGARRRRTSLPWADAPVQPQSMSSVLEPAYCPTTRVRTRGAMSASVHAPMACRYIPLHEGRCTMIVTRRKLHDGRYTIALHIGIYRYIPMACWVVS